MFPERHLPESYKSDRNPPVEYTQHKKVADKEQVVYASVTSAKKHDKIDNKRGNKSDGRTDGDDAAVLLCECICGDDILE